MESAQIWQPGRYRQLVIALSHLCYWGVHELGEQMTLLAGRLGISAAAVGKSLRRGAALAREKGYQLNLCQKSRMLANRHPAMVETTRIIVRIAGWRV